MKLNGRQKEIILELINHAKDRYKYHGLRIDKQYEKELDELVSKLTTPISNEQKSFNELLESSSAREDW